MLWTRYFVCLIFQILGLFIFLKGFFPPKITIPGFSSFADGYNGTSFSFHGKPQFEKLILVVVDAMRSDFMYSSSNSHMLYLHGLIGNGSAIPFTAFSHPPTVTLPRLKGITTGGTPSFVDAILNVADDNDNSQGLSETDSWLFQLRRNERVLHFYGDDTWLKLFPPKDFFEKYEGTHSFFVSDFEEVDLNVTRHLPEELEDDSWDVLILHYLGLDHIGHKGGPYSSFMKPKQEEMDDVLRSIFRSRVAESEDTLLVLMGDHGMNELGNHGGSSDGETSPGLVFISPKFASLELHHEAPLVDDVNFQYYSRVSQIDLVPTLAALLNVPIPLNSLGVLIPDFLGLWGDSNLQKDILLKNCEQLIHLVRERYSNDPKLTLSWESEFENLHADVASISDCLTFARKAQTVLTEAATNYHYFEIFLGFALIFVSCFIQLYSFWKVVFKLDANLKKVWIYFFVLTVIYSVHYHGSSLIEEEHQIWWFIFIVTLSASQVSCGLKSLKFTLIILVCMRIVRGWSNSGQKYNTSLTLASQLSNNSVVLWVLTITTYAFVSLKILLQGNWIGCFDFWGMNNRTYKSDDIASFLAFVVTFVVSSLSLLFKVLQFSNDGNKIPKWLSFYFEFICESFDVPSVGNKTLLQNVNIRLSNMFTGSLVCMIVLRTVVGKFRILNDRPTKDLLNMFTLLLLHYMRLEQIPTVLLYSCVKYCLISRALKPSAVPRERLFVFDVMLLLCFQNLSFFSVGNTNLLATVDLTNAYNGLSEYNVLKVALLTFISNFSAAIYWSLAGIEYLHEAKQAIACEKKVLRDKFDAFFIKNSLTLVFYTLGAVNLVGSCINLRFHLFIWSVFSPKLLYFGSWTILMNLMVDLIWSWVLLSV